MAREACRAINASAHLHRIGFGHHDVTLGRASIFVENSGVEMTRITVQVSASPENKSAENEQEYERHQPVVRVFVGLLPQELFVNGQQALVAHRRLISAWILIRGRAHLCSASFAGAGAFLSAPSLPPASLPACSPSFAAGLTVLKVVSAGYS